MRLCFSPTLPSLRRIQFCMLLHQSLLPLCGEQLNRVVPPAFRYPDKLYGAFSALIADLLIFAFVSVVYCSAVRAEHRVGFPSFFQSSVTSFFLYNIRNLANIKGKKIPQDFHIRANSFRRISIACLDTSKISAILQTNSLFDRHTGRSA